MPPLQAHPANAADPAIVHRRAALAFGRAGLAAGIVLAALLGAWISLRYSFDRWAVDPDVADPLLIWSGVRAHGLAFLKSWHYTQDNWLLSLVPLTVPAYALLGASPAVVIGGGWAIFLACVLLTALLAWRAAGPPAAGLLAAMLLFANNDAIGGAGFLAYPVVHNISLAWGLGALALAARGLERGSIPALAGAGGALLVGALSDPWLSAAMTLPLLAAGAALAVLHRGTRTGRNSRVLCLAVAAALVLTQTRMLGLMRFLPRTEFGWADLATIGRNLVWLARAMSAVFNVIPGANSQAPSAVAANGAALLLALGSVATAALLRFRRAGPRFQLLAGTALLSIPAVAAAFLLGSFPGGTYIGRYLMNVYFLGPLLGALVLGRAEARGSARKAGRAPAPMRVALLGYAALFAVSGACSKPSAWTGGLPSAGTAGTTELADFLRANGLSYGYGPYWGSEANAIGWISQGRVVIRPVQFNRATSRAAPRWNQTSAFWYAPSDRPPGMADTFLIVMDDGENCPVVEACVAAAAAQFGTPARRLAWKNMSILVWPHELLSRLDK